MQAEEKVPGDLRLALWKRQLLLPTGNVSKIAITLLHCELVSRRGRGTAE